MPGPLSPHDALIYIMVTMSAVDREMTDKEMLRIGQLVQNLPAFRNFDINQLVKTAESCGKFLSQEDGLDRILKEVSEQLPNKLHETAYALAVEVAAADLNIQDEELRFLQLLRDALNLEPLICAAIERGARARHQTI
jgi:tellurite resistance protein